ncbi:RdgB/HAM1 family non-canonical purine NTP pyrophosphatase [bacterium]|nr:RdgB/HAM1 family non-canonical purine NTP pyrophosphatase [bacterium]
MKKVIIATHNKHKLIEFNHMLKPLGYEAISLFDLNYFTEIEETGTTFEENSYIKAQTIYNIFHMPVIADDSGLSVDALNGLPGIYSHRYSGENGDDKSNREKLILELKKIPESHFNAKFICAITYIDDAKTIKTLGILDGEIILEERGNSGFGYDPIFYLKDLNKTVAELGEEKKNEISHRHIALLKLTEELKSCNS